MIDDTIQNEYIDDINLKEFMTFCDEQSSNKADLLSEVIIKYGEANYKSKTLKLISTKFLTLFSQDFLLYFNTRYGDEANVNIKECLKALKVRKSQFRNQCIHDIILILINFGVLNKELDDNDKRYEFKNQNDRYVSISNETMLFVFEVLHAIKMVPREDNYLFDDTGKIEYIKIELIK